MYSKPLKHQAPFLRTTAEGHMPLSHSLQLEVLSILCVCAYFPHVLSACPQPSSTLSSYVPACAYSPTNQYGVYSGPAGGYVAPGHHHWQTQSPALSHPSSGMSMHAGEIHSPMTFKHQAREGTGQAGILLLSLLLLLVIFLLNVVVVFLFYFLLFEMYSAGGRTRPRGSLPVFLLSRTHTLQ